MIQARVTKFLNIRTGLPEIEPTNNPGFLKPNDTVKIVDTVLGANHKGNRIWYRLEDGGFVWSGGVEQQLLTDSFDWWHLDYKMEDVWKSLNTWGAGSEITVIDSGIDLSNPFIDKNLVFAQNADLDSPDIEDKTGHGTSVVSVIGGSRLKNFGTAPLAKIHFIKPHHEGSITEAHVVSALKVIPNDVDIISISLRRPNSVSFAKELSDIFANHKDKVFLCAAGNDGTDRKFENLPASLANQFENVISVNAIDRAKLTSNAFSCRSDAITLAGPGIRIKASSLGDNSKMSPKSGTSFATPIVAGLIALGKSYQLANTKFNGTPAIAKMLKDTVEKDPLMEKSLYGLGVINPIAFCDLLINTQ